MAQSAVTRAFEAWNVNKVVDGLPAVPDSVVFALIPDQDENAPINRDEGMPAAEYIRHRAAITQAGILNINAVVYSVVLDTTIGDWDYNWIGLVDSKTNTVLMVVHVRTQQKLKTRNGQQGNSLTRNLSMQFDGAADATQINVSAETWQIDFSARLFGMDEAHRLTMRDYYGNAAFLNDGFRVSLANGVATVAAGVGYVGGLRARLDAAATLNVSANTSVWLDVSRQGTVTGAWENRITLTAAAALADYIDQAGYAHYVVKLSEIVNGKLTDNRPRSPVAELDDRFIQKNQNGADIPDKAQFRQNVGLSNAMMRGEFGVGGQCVPVPSGVNVLDFFRTVQGGNYSASLGQNTGIPDGDVSYLFCWAPTLSNEYGSLTAIGLNNSLIYQISIRAGVWGAWSEFYTTRFKPTAADVGALSISGGTLQGGLRIGAGNIELPASHAVVGVMPDGGYRRMLSLSLDNAVTVGNPTSSTVIHTGDRVYVVVADGAWHSVYHEGNLTPSAIGAIPVSELAGMPQLFPGAVAPAGWLKCNGQQFDTAQYPVLTSRYPSGFLPDLRGEFVRGWDDSRGIDNGRSLLSAQGDEFKSHAHGNVPLYMHPSGDSDRGNAGFSWFSIDDLGMTETAGGNETRPRNIAFNYIVRAA